MSLRRGLRCRFFRGKKKTNDPSRIKWKEKVVFIGDRSQINGKVNKRETASRLMEISFREKFHLRFFMQMTSDPGNPIIEASDALSSEGTFRERRPPSMPAN